MNKDASATRADQARGGVASRIVRHPYFLILLIGLIGGVLVGILNFLAMGYGWKIQGDYFDVVDAPIRSLLPRFYFRAGWTSYMPIGNPYGLRMALVLISYWALIGSWVAWLSCVVHAGVVRDMARDKTCRYILFFALSVGAFVGSLSFLAASNGWEGLDNCFDSLNRPVYSVMDAISYQFSIEMTSMRKGFICWHAAAVIYWAIIGLFVAFIFCVVRILKKRKAERRSRASAE